MANELGANSQVSSDSGNHSGTLECVDGTNISEIDESTMSFEEEEKYARDGMITFLTDPDVAMKHFKNGIQKGSSPLLHYGYSFVFFIRAILSFSDTRQEEAFKVLQAAAANCRIFRKRMPKGSARRIYYAIMQNDCELFQAFLYFMKESVSGYIKGGLGIRKAWKAYAKTFNKCEKLFTSRAPIRPPFSDSDDDIELSEPIKSLLSEGCETGSADLVEMDLAPSDETRVRRAVYTGYGTFHLLLSLIPQKFLKVANILGFQGDGRFGLECLHFALTGADMREPIAAINLLWFHTLLLPYISMSQLADDTALMEELRSVLSHLTDVSPNSTIARYFSGRIALLSRDMDAAMGEYQLCREGNFFPKEMLLITSHETAFLAMLQGDFESALKEIQSIVDSGTMFQASYLHMSGLLTGYLSDAREALKLFESAVQLGSTRQNPTEKFCLRRCAYYNKEGVTYVGMHVALLEQLYMTNSFMHCTPRMLATNLENVQSCVASATDPLTRCIGLIAQGSILKYMGCPAEAQESFNAILSCGAKALKNEKHILVYANIEMSVLARLHLRDANQSIAFLHTARDKYSDYDFDGRIQMIISRELAMAKKFRRQSKVEK